MTLSRGETRMTTSTVPLAATIFYRDVPLMPSAGENGVIKPLDKNAQKLIAWRLKDVSRDDSRVLLEHMPTCANCHSFTADGTFSLTGTHDVRIRAIGAEGG